MAILNNLPQPWRDRMSVLLGARMSIADACDKILAEWWKEQKTDKTLEGHLYTEPPVPRA